jgi:hypothetical protein
MIDQTGGAPVAPRSPGQRDLVVEFRSQPRSNIPVRTSVGTWLSLVEHSLGVRGVGSSNLPVPTNTAHGRLSIHRRRCRHSNYHVFSAELIKFLIGGPDGF